jgi:hypothetical protein
MTGSKVQCRIGHFAEPKIEPEIVVHFRTSPPVSADPTEVFASIDWIAHGIEIVQSHFLGWKFQAADTIADWGLHATLIVGKPLEVKQLGADVTADIENFIVKLSCDGDMREHLRAYIFLWLILQFGFQRACFSLSQAALSTYRFLLSSVCFRLMKDCIFQATLCNPYLIPNVIPISMLAKTY